MTPSPDARTVGLTMFPKTTIPAPATDAPGPRPRFARNAGPSVQPPARPAPRNAYQRGREAMRLDPYSPPRHQR
jgi:hypothetical protein